MRLVSTAAVAAAGSLVLASCDRDAPPAQPDLDRLGAVTQAAAGQPLAAVTPGLVTEVEARTDCPAGMALVEGDYCPKVQHRCLDYMDPEGPYEFYRCAEYAKPAQCLSKSKLPLRYCIDKDEFTPEGKTLPANFKSWTHAEKTCKGLGKRVCTESEWNFACEGEEMRPYPYGWKRDATACNADHTDIVSREGTLRDMRAPSDSYPRCTSPFGVRNLTGNLEEFVTIDGSNPPRPAMKGAYWQPGRNHCRAAQTAHDRWYNGMETGFRCCADVPEDGISSAQQGIAQPEVGVVEH